jgi:hypothetical protein
MLHETQNSLRAKQLEQILYMKLKTQYGIEDGGLSEKAVDLFDNGDIDSIYRFECCITELMSVCLHPDVQNQIPKWLKPELGKRLLSLVDFFKCLDWEKFHLYMAYTKIKDYGYNMSKEEIEAFERYYLN